MAFAVTAANLALNAITCDRVSLHTADPGTTGANYISGGGKQVAVFNTAASGERALNADVLFTGLGSGTSITWAGVWLNAGDVYRCGIPLTGDNTSNAAGEFTLKAGGSTKLTAS